MIVPPAYASVAVALPVPGPFTYALPPALQGRVELGHAVLVPFGSRQVTGYVLELLQEPGMAPSRVKPISRLLDPVPAFDADQLDFFRWMASYYQASLGDSIATALPAAMKAQTRSVHLPAEEGVEALAVNAVEGEEAEVLREVVRRPGLTRRGLLRQLSDLVAEEPAAKALDRLLRRGLVVTEQRETGGPGGHQRVACLQLEGAERDAVLPSPGKRQQAVLDALEAAGGAMGVAELVGEQGPYARAALRRLEELGVVGVELHERRDAVVTGELPAEAAPPTLIPAQTAAVEAILGPPKPWLLRGVTGSGKTEVYLRAAQEVLARGRQVLVLVPEIGLTPLLTGRFRARFGDGVAVLHSGLTGAQRLVEWRRIRAGEAQVAVGARSALFAPFHALGLIVVDEEHDDSYKQDEGVRYNARDLAIVRGKKAGCAVVLGSATPSMESWHNAKTGRYGLLEMLERPTPRPVPEIELIDLNPEPRDEDGRVPLVSGRVRQALGECFEAGGKAIVLYNRRGYATFVQCEACGGAYTCPSCGVGLVLHQRQRTLSCHYCGFHRPQAEACPACGGELEILGRGTERVEETLAALFPDVPIGRMDADTTSARGAHHRILKGFAAGETRMLVGTQIVAKGHDFPDVHLAVVLGADHVLMMPDFRAAERAYALITQLAGRAGRGDVAGRVLVQTHHPEHYALALLGRFPEFMDAEARNRRPLRYPPFARLALLRVESADRQAALDAAWALSRRLRASLEGQRDAQVLGPAQAALPRLVGRWRYQLLLRGLKPAPFHTWLSQADLSPPKGAKVRIVLDVDPRSLM